MSRPEVCIKKVRNSGLVVIDPEDREQVDRLALAYVNTWTVNEHGPHDETVAIAARQMRTALRSLIAPPKPPEPAGLGAVVEDICGDRWVRLLPDGGPAKWHLVSLSRDRDPWAVWSAIHAVRVLSKGVPA